MAVDELHIELNGTDYKEIIVNKKLHIHVSSNEFRYAVDLYKYNMKNPKEEDFIAGNHILLEELN